MAVEFLTDYSANTGNSLVCKWQDFYKYLFMKYMDGNIKRPNPGYQNPHVKYPGYGEDYYRKIIEETGDQFKVKDSSH